MESHESYKDWAQSVRRDARQKLAALREERLARSARRIKPSRVETPSDKPSHVPGPLPMSVSRHASGLIADPATTPVDAPPSGSPGVPGPVAGYADPLPETAPDPSMEEGQLPEGADTPKPVETCAAPEPETVLVAEEPARETPTTVRTEPQALSDATAASRSLDWEEDALRDSSLNDLPGAGIGLVWLLHANGITSLADLAEADAETLSEALGLVGRLIDLEAWIAHARRAV